MNAAGCGTGNTTGGAGGAGGAGDIAGAGGAGDIAGVGGAGDALAGSGATVVEGCWASVPAGDCASAMAAARVSMSVEQAAASVVECKVR